MMIEQDPLISYLISVRHLNLAPEFAHSQEEIDLAMAILFHDKIAGQIAKNIVH